MRSYTRMAVLPAALLAIAACGRARNTTAGNDDLKKDLQLASSSIDLATSRPTNIAISPNEELPPVSKPQAAHTLHKAPGPKAVRSKTPTVKAAPTTQVAAAEPTPQVQQTAPAPQPEPQPVEPSLPPATRPSPAPVPSQDPGSGRAQGDGGGIGIGEVIGGILGAVIRGGAVDGDRCEPHGGRRGRGGVWGGGVYVPGSGGRGYPAPGGGRSPFPINP